jgi:hypothetical protein
MMLALWQTAIQAIVSTLQWFGLYVGIRSLPSTKSVQRSWIVGSALVFAAWLVGVVLLGAAGFFRIIPLPLFGTLAVGYLFLLSRTFRGIIAGIPQHWLIGIQTFRIFGGLFLIRYFEGQLPGKFAIPAGIGDVLTGVFAALVAYWWFAGKPYARGAAIAWNLFGMADLVNAVTIGTIIGGIGIAFPIIPIYVVPRAFLIHSYSLIGLLSKTSRHPKAGESLHYGIEARRS